MKESIIWLVVIKSIWFVLNVKWWQTFLKTALWNLSWFKIFIVIKIENLKEKFLETWPFVLNIKCVGYLDT